MAQQVAPRVTAQRRGGVLTLDVVYIVAGLVLLGLRPLLTPLQPHDFWWHMATGRLIVAQGGIPAADSFSWTRAGEPFFNQGWLAQLLFYGLHQLGGVPLIVLVQSAVLVLAYGLLLRLCIVRSGRVRPSVALLLLATLPLSFDNWNVRPQSYAFLCFVGFLYVLTAYRLSPQNLIPSQRPAIDDQQPAASGRLWLLPLLMIVWVNLHGSFVLGGVLVALTLLGEGLKRLLGQPCLSWPAWRRLFVVGVASALALLLNPQGAGVLGYVRNLLGSSQVTRLVTEWAPPSVRETNGSIFFAFLLLSFVLLVVARRRPDATDMLVYVAFAWVALGAVRNIVWFGMVATPLLAVQAATLLPPAPRRSFGGSPSLNGILVGLLLLLYTTGLPWVKQGLWPPEVGALLAPATPVAAVDALRADADRPARLFNNMGYGSYLIWAAPEQKVFIDPRIELYPFGQWADYIALSGGHDVAELLAKHRVDGLLISKTEQDELVEALRAMPAWQLRYEDDEAAYYVLRP